MKVKCEKCDGYRDDCQCIGGRIADALERIAYALELANFSKVFPSTTTPAAGYRCAVCYTWVPNGSLHSCGGGTPPYRVGYASGGTISSCPTPHCWLATGHEGACQLVTIS